MPTLQLSVVSPESLLFSGQVDQVDLPGIEGDFGVLSGHARTVAMLRPGIVTVMTGNATETFVVLGEGTEEQLTIPADSASSVEDFDVAELRSKIGCSKAWTSSRRAMNLIARLRCSTTTKLSTLA